MIKRKRYFWIAGIIFLLVNMGGCKEHESSGNTTIEENRFQTLQELDNDFEEKSPKTIESKKEKERIFTKGKSRLLVIWNEGTLCYRDTNPQRRKSFVKGSTHPISPGEYKIYFAKSPRKSLAGCDKANPVMIGSIAIPENSEHDRTYTLDFEGINSPYFTFESNVIDAFESEESSMKKHEGGWLP